MRILKFIGLFLLGLFLLFLVVALFLPKDMHIERSIVINKSVTEVYPEVADFNNWRKWNPWTEMEPSSKNSVSGTPGQPGSVWAWEGDTVGVGSMTLLSVEENKSLKSKLQFVEPWKDESQSSWIFETQGDKTKVSWIFDDKANYPIGRYFGLFMDGLLGKDLEKGLQNLKNTCEKKQ